MVVTSLQRNDVVAVDLAILFDSFIFVVNMLMHSGSFIHAQVFIFVSD